jgi:AhpD family alkylhydroperoxidase
MATARIAPYPARGFLVRLAYWFARRRFGRVPGPVRVFAHNPWTLSAVAGFELASERGRAAPARLKELASVKVATLVGCRFCIDIGSSIARGHGVTEEELMDLPSYRTSPRLSELDKRVLDYAVAMTETPVVVEDDLFKSLLTELGREGLVELTSAIAWENYRARFNHAVGIKEEGYAGGVVCLLPAPAETAAAPTAP